MEQRAPRFAQQSKKGVLEMLVLDAVCKGSTYGYELLTGLKARSNELFTLKEGTLYPILYRLEDDGLIESSWSQGEGRMAPKKMYSATEKGKQEWTRRWQIWGDERCQAEAESSEGCEKPGHGGSGNFGPKQAGSGPDPGADYGGVGNAS